jgi:P pilus assembly chaperone PapD
MQITKRILPLVPLILLFSSTLTHAASLAGKSWQKLEWKTQGEALTVTNTGAQPVHLGRDVMLMPDEMPLTLLKTTLQPGETLQVYGACPHHLPLQKTVKITPIADNGQSEGEQALVIHHP